MMRTMLTVALLVSTVPAFGQESAADSLFRQGREAIVSGDLQKGCGLLAESDRIEPSPGAKLNLGLCEEQLSHHARAWDYLQQVIHSLPASDARVAVAERHATQLVGKLAFATIRVTGVAVGMRINTDLGELPSTKLGARLAFDPGTHFFEVSAPDHETQRVSVALDAGTFREVNLALHPISRQLSSHARAGSTSAASQKPPQLRSWGVALLGSASALLLTSLITGGLALYENGQADHNCDARGACTEQGLRAANRGAVFATVSTLTFAGAAATGGAGALLLVWGNGGTPTRASTALGTTVRIGF